jgi:hypothetical protein
VRTLVAFSIVVLAVGCKSKPKPRAAPPDKVETAGSAAGSGSAAMAPPKDIVLPQGPGTPPIKTTKPVDYDTLAKVAQMRFPGFNAEERTVNQKAMWVVQQTPDHPVLRAGIHINHCTDTHCQPMDLANWKARAEELKQYLSDGLKKANDTIFEVGETDVHGEKMIYTYQLGWLAGGSHSEWSHAYILYWNDGINDIHVIAEFKDDMPVSRDILANSIKREDLEHAAKAFMDVYTQAW